MVWYAIFSYHTGRINVRVLRQLFNCVLAGSVGSLLVCALLRGAMALGFELPVRAGENGFCLDWGVPRMVVWSFWGLLFLLPVLSDRPIRKGLLISLVPSIFMLLEVSLHEEAQGVVMAVFFVLAFNAVWSLCTAGWLRLDRHWGT